MLILEGLKEHNFDVALISNLDDVAYFEAKKVMDYLKVPYLVQQTVLREDRTADFIADTLPSQSSYQELRSDRLQTSLFNSIVDKVKKFVSRVQDYDDNSALEENLYLKVRKSKPIANVKMGFELEGFTDKV